MDNLIKISIITFLEILVGDIKFFNWTDKAVKKICKYILFKRIKYNAKF